MLFLHLLKQLHIESDFAHRHTISIRYLLEQDGTLLENQQGVSSHVLDDYFHGFGMETFAAIMGTVLSTSIGIQVIVCTSMLAVIAVEVNGVRAGVLASISAMRNTNVGPLWLMFLIGKGLWRRHVFKDVILFIVVLLISATALLSHSISPQLVTDLDLSSIQGNKSPLATQQNHFVYNPTNPDVDLSQTIPQITRGPQWLRQPPFYASFAEYSDP